MYNVYKTLIKNSYKNKFNTPNENKSSFKILKQNNYKFNTIDKCPYCENCKFIKYFNLFVCMVLESVLVSSC